jgi:hypothetical protein
MVAGGDDILQNSGDALRKGMRFSHWLTLGSIPYPGKIFTTRHFSLNTSWSSRWSKSVASRWNPVRSSGLIWGAGRVRERLRWRGRIRVSRWFDISLVGDGRDVAELEKLVSGVNHLATSAEWARMDKEEDVVMMPVRPGRHRRAGLWCIRKHRPRHGRGLLRSCWLDGPGFGSTCATRPPWEGTNLCDD